VATRARLALLIFFAPLAAHAALPLVFESNRGQTDGQVRFLARGEGYTLFLTDTGLLAAGSAGHVRLTFAGARAPYEVEALEPLPGRSHYFLGSGREGWRTNVPLYGRVRMREIYPGISLVFYGTARRVEFDFLISPGTNPDRIRMQFHGGVPKVLADGSVSAGPLRLGVPAVYQDRRRIEGRYVVLPGSRLGFVVGPYDRSRTLNIDPVLAYSSYLGGDGAMVGGNDYPAAIAVDAVGNVYIAGLTESPRFPTTANAPVSTFPGWTLFAARFDPSGVPVYSTYFSGTAPFVNGTPVGLAVDASGNLYLTGTVGTSTAAFPATPGACQSRYAGGNDGYVLKLDPRGTAVYMTLLGGEGQDTPTAIAVDAGGNAYIAGYTFSNAFPVTEGALQSGKSTPQAPFVAKLDPGGARLMYATYLGADTDRIYAIAIDPASQNLLVAGDSRSAAFPLTKDAIRSTQQNGEGFLLKLSGSGGLVYSTFLGGDGGDSIRAMDIDAAGNIYVAGQTSSFKLPVTANASQGKPGGVNAFLMQLDNAAGQILHCTYLGGTKSDVARAVRVDSSGNVAIVGDTTSPDFPVSDGAPLPGWPGGPAATFLTVYSGQDMRRLVSTYLDAAGRQYVGMALDPGGDPWLLFNTQTRGLPVTDGAVQKNLAPGGFDAYLERLGSLGTTVQYASYFGGPGSSTDEQAYDVAVDASGNLYVTGVTGSSNFPTTEGAVQKSPASSGRDAFVAKLDSTGKTLLFSTYLGGSSEDRGTGIALDGAGNVYIAGTTSSSNFPVTADAVQPKPGGNTDAFLARLAADGSALLYATYLGGSGQDTGAALAARPGGEVYLTGNTASPDFPLKGGSLESPAQGTDVYVARFQPDGASLGWSARIGGSGQDTAASIALDGGGNAFLTGMTDSPDFPTTSGVLQRTRAGGGDVFVIKLDADGKSLAYSTCLGGTREDRGVRIKVDESGNAYVAGNTQSNDFPTTAGAFRTTFQSNDGFLAEIDPQGAALVFSTLIGGPGVDTVSALALDGAGNIWVGGTTTSLNNAGTLATRDTGIQINPRGGNEGMVAKIDPAGKRMLYGSYFGGSGNDTINALAVDAAGDVYAAGATCSTDLPVTAEAFQSVLPGTCSAFAARMDMAKPTPPRALPIIRKISDYALGGATFAAGSIIVIEGDNLASATVEFARPGQKSAALPLTLGGATVNLLCLGTRMGLFSASPNKIVGHLPYSVAPQCNLQVVTGEGDTLRPITPGTEGNVGILAVYKSDMTVSTPDNRIQPGDIIIVHVTGAPTDPQIKPPSGVPLPESPIYEVAQGIPAPNVAQPDFPLESSREGTFVSQIFAPGYVGVAEIRVKTPDTAPSDSGVWDFYFGYSPKTSNKVRIYPVIVPRTR
jgi:hypothetical protein